MISRWQLQQAAQKIRHGALIACPTEAVWGLSCDPMNRQAVERLLNIKQRQAHKGLILVAADIQQLTSLLDGLPNQQLQQLQQSWPGPNTWLVPHRNLLPAWITGSHATVALRVSAHPLLQQLCQLTGPLVSTSANPARRPAASSRLRVEQYFHGQLDLVLNGQLGQQQQPSCIRDLATGQIIRPA